MSLDKEGAELLEQAFPLIDYLEDTLTHGVEEGTESSVDYWKQKCREWREKYLLRPRVRRSD